MLNDWIVLAVFMVSPAGIIVELRNAAAGDVACPAESPNATIGLSRGTLAAMAVAIRDKILENSQQFLQQGEQVQAVIGGQTLSGWWGALTSLFFFWNNFQAVLVTDRRIIVLHCGKWRLGKPQSIVRELPRNTKIGPATGLWWKCTTLGDKLYVHKRFHKDVATADAVLIPAHAS